MNYHRLLTLFAGGAALTTWGVGVRAAGAAPEGEPAIYWISAQTGTGLSGDMRAMLMGGSGSGPSRDLVLQLASRARPASAASGDHLVPSALRVGPSLPLVAPPASPQPREGGGGSRGLPSEMQGRMVIYWGCGETAANAPRTVDMRNPGAAFSGVAVRSMQPPSATSHAGYAEWPNPKSKAELKSASSLTGAHLVRSNFTPEMKFELAPNQDFLAPLKLAQQKNASGSLNLSWASVDRANGYFLSIMGTAADGTAVIWTSSQVPLATFMIDEFLDPGEVGRLVAQKAVMAADARSCTVPAAVMKAIETPLLTMNAFGQEVNMAEPRPAAAPTTWRPSWLVKVRHRTTTRLMLGEAGDAMSAMQGDQDGGDAAGVPQRRKGGLLRSLGKGLIPGT